MKKKLPYIIGFIILTCIEVFIALRIHDSFIRPYLGDVLVMGLLYCLLRSILPDGLGRYLTFYIFLIGLMAELLQYIDWVTYLGLQSNTFLRVLLGSTFDINDVICYGIGCSLIASGEKLIKVRCRR